MEFTESPSFLRLCESDDFSRYSQDDLNQINEDFMKQNAKLKDHVEYTTIYFGNFIQQIQSGNWNEAENSRENARNECERLIKFLVMIESKRHGDHQGENRSLNSSHRKQNTFRNMHSKGQSHLKPKLEEFKSTQQRRVLNGFKKASREIKKRENEIKHTKQGKSAPKKQTTGQGKIGEHTGNNKYHQTRQTIADPCKTSETKQVAVETTKHIQTTENGKKPKSKGNTKLTFEKKSIKNANTHQENTKSNVSGYGTSSDLVNDETDYDDILRRSEEASLLLHQGNPNIADLSDNNRATKLGERFSELYSNEYTNAFEELEKAQLVERDITQLLLCIVKNAYIYCQRKAKTETSRQKAEALDDLKKRGYSSDNVKMLWKGYVAKSLKQRGLEAKDDICQEFIREEFPRLIPEFLKSKGNKTSAYAHSSVEILWFMCIQDPPLCIKWIEDKDTEQEFDTNLYRFYTKSGKYVEYCVWPLLLLYDGGPILTKGIAQGK